MNIQPLSKSNFSNKYWQKPNCFLFAGSTNCCRLTISEVSKALMSYPIGFVQTDSDIAMVAILGLEDNRNVFVTTEGNWLVSYVPAEFRCYPFSLRKASDNSEEILCIDLNSNLISQEESGFPFFEPTGEMHTELLKVLDFLSELSKDVQLTKCAIDSLHKFNLLEDWKIEISTGNKLHKLEGVLGVNEDQLSRLGPEELAELRETNALFLCYGQLLSRQHIDFCARMTSKLRNEEQSVDVDDIYSLESGVLSFDNF